MKRNLSWASHEFFHNKPPRTCTLLDPLPPNLLKNISNPTAAKSTQSAPACIDHHLGKACSDAISTRYFVRRIMAQTTTCWSRFRTTLVLPFRSCLSDESKAFRILRLMIHHSKVRLVDSLDSSTPTNNCPVSAWTHQICPNMDDRRSLGQRSPNLSGQRWVLGLDKLDDFPRTTTNAASR